jgi:putative tryptophan/tyrosine transport system substrate-binding protein
MRRRDFIAFMAGAAVAWPIAVRGQQRDRIRRIGVLLGIGNDAEGQIRVAAFKRQMHELGWVEGENVRIDYRWAAGNPDLVQADAAELVGLAPEVIVGTSTPVTAMLRHKTSSIPIVFVVVTDPVGNGFLTNMARPEGNLTGFTNFELSMGGKWVELLKQIAPDTAQVGLMFNPANSPAVRSYYGSSLDAAAASFGIKLIDLPIRDAGEVERALNDLGRESHPGFVVLPDNTTVRYRDLIASLGNQRRLPGIYPYRYFATAGGLVSYGVDTVDLYHRAAFYVDRILRGAKPADLPVQQPMKFELVINLKTAAALGLTVAPWLLARADEVIE